MKPNPPYDFRIQAVDGSRPPTMNAINRMQHHYLRTAALAPWKAGAHTGLMVERLKQLRFDRVRLEFWPFYPQRPIPDADAFAHIHKAAADALVDVGIIPDDNEHHYDRPVAHPPQVVGGRVDCPLLVCRIVELGPSPGHLRDECDCRESWQASQAHNQLRQAR